MLYALLNYFGLKALIASIIFLIALMLTKRASNSARNVLAVASLIILLTLPFEAMLLPHQSVTAPDVVAKPLLYARAPQMAVYDIAKTTYVAPVTKNTSIVVIDYVTAVIGWTWVLMALFLVAKIVIGLIKTRSLARRAKAFGPSILVSDEINVPMAAWIGKSLILLPSDAPEWEAPKLARILAHERAHIARLDLLWNILGQIACAIYWPVPTVWALQRISRETAERACDDYVLRSGATPSDYAQDLLEVAKDVRHSYAITLPLTTKSEVHERISHVLANNIKRNVASVKSRLTTSVVACSLALPVAVFGIAQLPQDTHPTPPTPEGWASPGSWSATSSNGWTGLLPDGRKVQLVQIQRFNGKGYEAWKPDGTPIENAPIYGGTHWMTKPNRLVFVIRFQSDVKDDSLNGGLGSGPYSKGDPKTQVFAGGGILPAKEKGWRTSLNLIEIEGEMTHSSYTFGISDSAFNVLGTIYPPSNGSSRTNYKTLEDVSYVAFDSVKIPVDNGNGDWLTTNGKRVERTLKGCSISFFLPGRVGDLKATAFDRSGKAHQPVWNLGQYISPAGRMGLQQRYWFEVKDEDLDRVEIATRGSSAVEILDVKLEPKSSPIP